MKDTRNPGDTNVRTGEKLRKNNARNTYSLESMTRKDWQEASNFSLRGEYYYDQLLAQRVSFFFVE